MNKKGMVPHFPSDHGQSRPSAKREPDGGLGDTIKRVTTAVGIQPCTPCEERRRKLNAMFPYRQEEKK